VRFTHSSSTRRFLSALIGGLFAMLMTLVFVAPADATENKTHPLYQISPTSFPYNSIVEITIPGKALDGTPMGRCTGWLYANNMIATAGHCVYDKRAVTNGQFDTRGIRVWPGVNGSTMNAKSCGVVKSYVPTGWTSGQSATQGGSEYFDYGAFRLDCNLTTGNLDYGMYTPTVGQFTRICGYPKNRALDTQWCSDGHVQAVETYQTFYDNDTCRRMSGSPVLYWVPVGTSGYWSVIAIHTYPEHAQGTTYVNHYSYNHGTSITSTVYNDLSTWARDTSAGTPPNPPTQPDPINVSSTCD
jgi:V8-like Glu-specific endopeptidase